MTSSAAATDLRLQAAGDGDGVPLDPSLAEPWPEGREGEAFYVGKSADAEVLGLQFEAGHSLFMANSCAQRGDIEQQRHWEQVARRLAVLAALLLARIANKIRTILSWTFTRRLALVDVLRALLGSPEKASMPRPSMRPRSSPRAARAPGLLAA